MSSFPAVATVFLPTITGMSAAYYQYQADVTGLQAGVTYQYQVVLSGQIVASDPAQYSFRTPTAGNFSFLVLGDSGNDSAEQTSLIQLMNAEPNISKFVHVGDLAYPTGTFAEVEQSYYGQNAALMSRIPFFATAGNHEYLTNSGAPYLAGQATPVSGVPAVDMSRYYSHDWGDVHFTSIDSNLLPNAAASARMLTWLAADLAATQKYWKIVFLHHPPYPTGYHLGDPICALVEQNVNPIVEKYGVQLVLSGHEHGYERSWPLVAGQTVPASVPSTTYVISGGGGGDLETVGSLPQCALSIQAYNYLRVDLAGASLKITATGLNGTSLDTFTLNPPPSITPGSAVNAADYSKGIAPGSLVTVFGQNLALRSVSATALPLPDSLGGISATANGVPAPLLYVSPGQINVQMPYEVSGTVNLTITTPNGTTSEHVTVTPTAPGILAVVAPSTAPGSYVTMYVTGLGAPMGIVGTGQPAPNGAMPVAANVQIMLGNQRIQPAYAGMAPGFAGLGQINFQIPAGMANGTYPLAVVAGQATSLPSSFTVSS